MHVLAELSSTLSPSVGAATMMSHQPSPANARKPSPIRAFLTPPLLRKRKQQPISSTTKLLSHEEHGHSTTTGRLFGSSVLPNSSSHRGKSFGFLSLLKVNLSFPSSFRVPPPWHRNCSFQAKFVDRSGRLKQQPVVQSTSSVSTVTHHTEEMTYTRSEDVPDPSIDLPCVAIVQWVRNFLSFSTGSWPLAIIASHVLYVFCCLAFFLFDAAILVLLGPRTESAINVTSTPASQKEKKEMKKKKKRRSTLISIRNSGLLSDCLQLPPLQRHPLCRDWPCQKRYLPLPGLNALASLRRTLHLATRLLP